MSGPTFPVEWLPAASWQLALFICVVGVADWLLRPFSARLRYSLWLLVLLKAFLPPTLSAPWSLGDTAVVEEALKRSRFAIHNSVSEQSRDSGDSTATGEGLDVEPASATTLNHLPRLLTIVWAAGCAGLWLVVGWRYIQLLRSLTSCEAVDEGPLRVALEEIALDLKLKRVPELFTTEISGSPFLVGVIRPRIVVPQSLVEQLEDDELRAVLLHELIHWKRCDSRIGWLQLIVQGLFWFHPLVWWANGRLRHARESACDEAVLQLERITPQRYGEAIVRILTASRGRSVVAGSLVGVFERGTQLQNRLEEIMSYEQGKRRFSWMSRGTVALFAVLFLPMSAGVAQPAAEVGPADDSAAVKRADDGDNSSSERKTRYPQIVQTVPESGGTDVNPELDAITVTFDRDMQGGMSWTGGKPHFPTTERRNKPFWKDKRTCVLPVRLAKGRYYRLGINSKSFRNFRSAEGVPAPPSVIRFATEGASKSVKERVRVPRIVKLVPENGAKGVDPSVEELRVTFDVPMGESFSWTGGGASFPEIPKGARPRWSEDGRTCILPVKLKPNAQYRLGLNSLSHNNFQSEWGVPLEPVGYEFSTGGAGSD